MTKTPEEKAREIAKQEAFNNSYDDESYREMYDIVESGFLNGYHSRDEEVKVYREALKEILNYEKHCVYDISDKSSFNAHTRLLSAIDKAKQLLEE